MRSGVASVGADMRHMGLMVCTGMGVINAVDIAQHTHLEILSDGGALHRFGLLEWGSEFPGRKLSQGIYIDDGAVAGIVDTAKVKEPGAESDLTKEALSAPEGAGVEIAWQQRFRSRST